MTHGGAIIAGLMTVTGPVDLSGPIVWKRVSYEELIGEA
jgi:hypothetical protein